MDTKTEVKTESKEETKSETKAKSETVKDIRSYHGVRYLDALDAKLAADEDTKIEVLKEKTAGMELEQQLSVYNTVVKGNVFHSPVGYAYMAEWRKKIVQQGVGEDAIENLQMEQVFSPDLLLRKRQIRQKKEKASANAYKHKLKNCIFTIAALVVCIIAMFFILLSSDRPTILNYRTKIQNEYASWEQELTERENILREKEQQIK